MPQLPPKSLGTLRVPVRAIEAMDRNRSGHITEADLEQGGAPFHLKGVDAQGHAHELALGPESIGLAARLFEYTKKHAVGDMVELPASLLQESPTDRVLLACDSYEASLRPSDPERLLETMLRYPDPKVRTFEGGLVDESGQPRSYPVVTPSGAIEDRSAQYDGKTLHVYVPAHETEVIQKLLAQQAERPEFGAIAVAPLHKAESQSFDKRMELRFDRPGVLWASTRCPLLPELADDAYLVPGGRFGVEAYYHDARINLPGARSTLETHLQAGRRDDAARVLSVMRGTTNLFVNQILAVGKVLNANLTVYLGRSQPPCLTTCIKETLAAWQTLADGDPVQEQQAVTWAKWAMKAAELEYEEVWTSPPRLHAETGLSRYVDEAPSQAPEEEPAHYAGITWTKDDLAADAAIREHGWDSHVGALAMVGPEAGSIRQHKMLPVCLNTLLYKYERDLAELHTRFGDTPAAKEWDRRADSRQETMRRLMWNELGGLYTDLLELPSGGLRKNGYEDLRAFMPLWAGLEPPDSSRSARMAARIDDFLREGGVATATEESWQRAHELNPAFTERCQWGHKDIGWPIVTYETVLALASAGQHAKANEIAYRWCYAVQEEAEKSGGLQYSKQGEYEAPVMEKMDVVGQGKDGAASVGYGNQGAGHEGEGGGFRWGYDAFKLLVRGLPAGLRKALAAGISPSLVRFDAPADAGGSWPAVSRIT